MRIDSQFYLTTTREQSFNTAMYLCIRGVMMPMQSSSALSMPFKGIWLILGNAE